MIGLRQIRSSEIICLDVEGKIITEIKQNLLGLLHKRDLSPKQVSFLYNGTRFPVQDEEPFPFQIDGVALAATSEVIDFFIAGSGNSGHGHNLYVTKMGNGLTFQR